jgi:CSLREA domain-containing protein
LATAATLTANGNVTINGTFQINQGGFATGTGTYSYNSSTGTLVYNNTSGVYGPIDSGHTYWPATNGPQNVTVQGAGGINLGVARTVGGLFQYAAGVSGANNLTLNGTAQVNAGGFMSGSPTYGGSSLLKYNTGGSYGRNGEWLPGVTSGAGYPNGVQLSGNTALDLPNGSTNSTFQVAKGLQIDAGSALNMGAMTQALTVLGSVQVDGTLALSTASGGDIKVGGGWTRNATTGTFTPNGRAVFFNGSGIAQSINVSGGGTETFNYLVVNSASVVTDNTFGLTHIAVNSTSGDVLQLLGGGLTLDNGSTLTLSGNGGNILASGGARTILGPGGGSGTVSFTGSKTVTSASGGTLAFASNVTVNLAAGVNFGPSLSTVNGTLNINSGGFVNTNAPTYAANSTLSYISGGTYGRGQEWSATSGAGYPANVQLSNNTTLDMGANGGGTVARQMAGSLTVNSGSTVSLAVTPMSAAVTVLGNVTNLGTIALSTVSGGDLKTQGNFNTSGGTFTPNARAVFFEGGNTQNLSTGSALDYVVVNKTGGTVLALTDVVTNAPGGGNAFAFQTAQSTYTLNGKFLQIGGPIGAGPAGSGFIGDAAASLHLFANGGAQDTLTFASNPTLSSLNVGHGNGFNVTLGSSLTVNSFSISGSTLTTNANTLTINGSSARVGGATGGCVIGNVRKNFAGPGPADFTFHVGTANGFTPVTANNTLGAGSLTVSATQTKQPNITGTNALARYWALSGSGITTNLTFQYLATDVVGTESNYQVVKYNGTFSAPPNQSVNTTAHTATVTGVSSFSDWTLAEAPAVFGALQFSAANYNDTETNAGTHNVTVTVQRTGASSGAVSVHYATSDGTATAGSDYTATSGDLNWADGDAADKTFNVTVNGDTTVEPHETINLTLSAPTGGAALGTPNTATVTIQNDDVAANHGSIQLSAATYSGGEGAGQIAVTVTRTGGSDGAVAVTFDTSNGTAAAGSDYTAVTNQTVMFADGDAANKTVNISVTDDSEYEGPETFNVALTNPTGGATLGSPAAAVVTISDNDAIPATLVVNTTDDSDDGYCLPAHCSLREAINAANASSDASTINFTIPGSGVHTITPATVLPTVTQPVTINGYTQPGAAANTLATGNDAVLLVELDGENTLEACLSITGGGSTVSGLVINRCSPGVALSGPGNNTVAGNFIGTNAAGTAASATGQRVAISNSSGNTVGGTSPAARNVLSGGTFGVVIDGSPNGATNNLIQGNYIGTDKNGTAALPNSVSGVQLNAAAQNTVGGTAAGARNVISGNFTGLFIGQLSTQNNVQGNYVGTDATGAADLGNSFGVIIEAADNTVGGATADARNVISGNNGDAVKIETAAPCCPADDNVVQGNYIGTNAAGTSGLPNGTGVRIFNSNDNQIGGTGAGTGNVIALNDGKGVVVESGTGNRIAGNAIFGHNSAGNSGLGSDLGDDGVTPNDAGDADTGPNNLQNFPVVTSATVTGSTRTITGTLNTTPNSSAGYTIEFFSNSTCDGSGYGEGQTPLGSLTTGTTDANGDVAFTFHPAALTAGQVVTATATDADGNTSEFSQCFAVAGGAAGQIEFTSATYNVAENVAGGMAAVTVTRTGGSDGAISATFSTSDGTATAGSDYTAVANASISYADGETGPKTVNVAILDDSVYEGDETVNLSLSTTAVNRPGDLNVGPPTGTAATLTIGEDDAAPTLAINNVGQDETNSGTSNVGFTVTKVGSTALSATVQFHTTDGSATSGTSCGPGVDYVSSSGTVTFLPAETSKLITLQVCGDTEYESDETYTVTLSNPTNATIQPGGGVGNGEISNDDAPPATLTVNTTDDVDNGFCLAAHCSLREALNAANAGPDANTINVNIPNTDPNFADGVFTIKPLNGEYQLSSGLVTVDGASQTAFTGDTNAAGPEVVIDGSLNVCGGTCNGFVVSTAGNTIRGLVINHFTAHGITMFGGATGNTIQGNYIGTDPTGTTAAGNGAFGITSPGGNNIGGLAAGEGNVISGNGFGSPSGFGGISLGAADVVSGNKIGTNAAGTAAIANKPYGIVANSGGGHFIEANLISGNTEVGVGLFNSANDGSTLKGNKIGTDAAGTSPVANGSHGIELCCGAGNNTVGGTDLGDSNVIAYNGGAGVTVHGVPSGSTGANGNRITGNSIHDNTGLGIDLGNDGVTPNDAGDSDSDPDANNLQNFPVITAATVTGSTKTIAGTLNSTPGQVFTLEFFANTACDASGNGEGATYLGVLTTAATDASGDVSFVFHPTALTSGQVVTATATDINGNTSEFSACVTVAGGSAGQILFTSPGQSVQEDAGTAHVMVTRVGGTDGAISATFSTSDGTATAGSDYTAVQNYTISYADGESGTKTVDVPILDDALYEGNETVNLSLSSTTVNRPAGVAPNGASTNTTVLTIVDDEPKPTVTINDVFVAEPTAGTTSATFTVTLSNAAAAPVTLNYATADDTATAPDDYTAIPSTPLSFASGELMKTISVTVNADASTEPAETFFVNLSNLSANATFDRAQGVGTITDTAQAGRLLVSEFRTRGPGGAADEFIELYNPANTPLTVATGDGSAGWAVVSSDDASTPKFVIPAGTVIPARGHFLGANQPAVGAGARQGGVRARAKLYQPAAKDTSPTVPQGGSGSYSLSAYAVADETFTGDITDGAGLAVFSTATPAAFDLAHRLDAVGFAGLADTRFREGAGLQPAAGVSSDAEFSFARSLATGLPADTDANANDFVLVATDPALVTGASAQLGAPGPEDCGCNPVYTFGDASPVQRNATVKPSLIEPQAASTAEPNRVRDLTANVCNGGVAPSNCTFGTLSIRRRFTNQTGQPVTRLRFRVVDVTTLNTPNPGGAQADVRLVNSGNFQITTSRGPLTVLGTQVETPPAQALGGGLNSSVIIGTLSGPLAPNASVDVQFLLGVQQNGRFRFLVNVEALP